MSDHTGNGHPPYAEVTEIARLDARINEWDHILNQRIGALERLQANVESHVSSIDRNLGAVESETNGLRVHLSNRLTAFEKVVTTKLEVLLTAIRELKS